VAVCPALLSTEGYKAKGKTTGRGTTLYHAPKLPFEEPVLNAKLFFAIYGVLFFSTVSSAPNGSLHAPQDSEYACPLEGAPQIRQGDSVAATGGRFNSDRPGGKHGALDLNSVVGKTVFAERTVRPYARLSCMTLASTLETSRPTSIGRTFIGAFRRTFRIIHLRLFPLLKFRAELAWTMEDLVIME